MPTPWDELRRDFPGLEGKCYLNAAATSLTPRPVREAVEAFYREQETGGEVFWDGWLERREAVRLKVARFIGALPDEIAFVPNTSAGINLIADLIERDGPVLTGELEFPTLTLPWLHRGVPVRFVTAAEGMLRLESFAAGQAPHAATLLVSHVQFTNGCRQDLDAFGALKAGRHFVVSASQSLGAFPVDVRRSGIDALACAGHKWLCAGYGAGFCYVSRELVASRPPRAVGWLSGDDPYRFDNRSMRLIASNARSELGCPPFGPIFALGAFPVDVRKSGIDALACAGHKWLCAGYGAGFCYVSRELVASRPPRAVGWLSGDDPYRFDNRSMRLIASNARSELGCPPFGPIFALGAAVEYLAGIGVAPIAERVLALNSYLTTLLARESFEVLSPGGEHRSGQTLVGVEEPAAAVAFLREHGVYVTEKPQGLRISTHFYNDERELESCVATLVAYRDQLPR